MTHLDIKEITLALLRKKGLTEAEPVKFVAGKCNAHKYELSIQGKKNWITYICRRNGCRHFATLDNIVGRVIECSECGRHAIVKIENVVKVNRLKENLNYHNSKAIRDTLYEVVTCGCNFNERSKSLLEELKDKLS